MTWMRRLPFWGLFLLPVTVFLLHLNQFIFPVGAAFSDITISHYPNIFFLQQTIAEYQQIPLWSPMIMSGYPFAADPLSGLYYFPGWLALLFPLPVGLNITVILHIIFSGIGMYRLLRQDGLEEPPAVFGGLVFAGLPKIIGHLGLGHLTLVYAIAWTPWLISFSRTMHTGSLFRRLMPGAILGMIALADIRWAAYAGIVWIADFLWRLLRQYNEPKNSKQIATSIGKVLFYGIFAICLSAAQIIPLFEFIRSSTRSVISASERQVFSLPPIQLLGLAYPSIVGSAEWIVYVGAVTLSLSVYALSSPGFRKKTGFWLLMIGITLLLSLGSYLPFLGAISTLPGFDLLRVPARALFITGFCFVFLASYGFQRLLDRMRAAVTSARDRSPVVVFAAACFIVFFGLAAMLVVNQPIQKIQFGWGAIFFLLGTIILLLGHARKLQVRFLIVSLFVVSLVDILSINGLSLVFRALDQDITPYREAASFIKKQAEGEYYRAYSPSYSIPQHVAAIYGIELADGVDPLQLMSYARFMESATGVPSSGYSVTIPPFAMGNPAEDNRQSMPDAQKLGLLNVKYVAAEYPLKARGLQLLSVFGKTYVYENTLALPRAWVQKADAPVGTEVLSTAAVTLAPNRVEVEAEGPGLLVLSEIAYPGWQVRVDGIQAEVDTPAGLLRGVRLGAGEHTVTFSFIPASVYAGLGLSIFALLVLIVTAVVGSRRNG